MILENRVTHKTILLIGMAFLLEASLSRWFLRPSGAFGADLVDGTNGFLYGISIGLLLLGILKTRCRSLG